MTISIAGRVTDLEFVSQFCKVTIRPTTALGAVPSGDDALVGVITRLYPDDDLDAPLVLPEPGFYHVTIQRRGGSQDFDTVEFDFEAVDGQPLSWGGMLADAQRVAQILLSGQLSRDALTLLIGQIFAVTGDAQSVVAYEEGDPLPTDANWDILMGTVDGAFSDIYDRTNLPAGPG